MSRVDAFASRVATIDRWAGRCPQSMITIVLSTPERLTASHGTISAPAAEVVVRDRGGRFFAVEHLKCLHGATLLMILTLVIDRRIWAGHTRVDEIFDSGGLG
jgi:hypothetical protein